MEAFSKLVRLHKILRARRGPISVYDLQDRLECSRPTLYRVIGRLRDDLGAPIVNIRGEGYKYDRTNGDFELPGLWLNAEELHALLTMDALLQQIQPGVLRDVVGPIRDRVEKLLGEATSGRNINAKGVRDYVQVTPMGARRVDPRLFGVIATGTLERKRLEMAYHGRARNEYSQRVVSPLRLRYYRDNWYLDGWCHMAEGLRRFSLDRVKAAEVLDEDAVAVDAVAEEAVADGYGIFTGKARYKAVLRFTPERARWVADEQWHPEQSGQMLTDGSYELTVPYSDPRELVGDILRHGAEVEVVKPRKLREAVAGALKQALATYQERSETSVGSA